MARSEVTCIIDVSVCILEKHIIQAKFVITCSQGLSQDCENACPKQQFQNFCLFRFSYLPTSNPYTDYI